MSNPERPQLPHPSASARHTKSGAQDRDRPVYSESGGEGLGAWEVEVTPLVATTSTGKGLDSGRQRPRAIFEVRAAFYGTGAAVFGSMPNVRRIPTSWEEEEELALAIARRLTEMLRAGNREIDILEVGREVKRRR